MIPNPFLGVFFHWLGGLASGSFYVPYKEVRKWAWETYWLVGGFFSWIIAPWVGATIMIPHLGQVLRETPPDVLFWAYFWGAMWGIGGLTFGLTMRYLGMSLGMAVALGYCAAFGTLMPPIFSGKIGGMFYKDSGLIILLGVAVCLGGIAVAGIAGMSKEKEMPEEEKKAAIKEFNFPKGILVATFSGILSASMAYGLLAANPMADLAIHLGTPRIWTGLPKLVVVLLGGFTTNFIWCVILNVRNKTGYQYFNSEIRGPVPTRDQETIIETASDAPGEEMARRATQLDFGAGEPNRAPMIRNYCFSALAGVTWYM